MMKKILRALPWILSLCWMGLIFSLSAQTAGESSQLSGGTVYRAADWLWKGFSHLSPEEQRQWVEGMQFWARKSAHFILYAVLGGLFFWGFSGWKGKKADKILWAWLAGTAYAVTDEIHQLLVPGRSGEVRDVLVDSAGVFAGVLAMWAFFAAIKKAAACFTAAKRQKKG